MLQSLSTKTAERDWFATQQSKTVGSFALTDVALEVSIKVSTTFTLHTITGFYFRLDSTWSSGLNVPWMPVFQSTSQLSVAL